MAMRRRKAKEQLKPLYKFCNFSSTHSATATTRRNTTNVDFELVHQRGLRERSFGARTI